MNAIKVSIRLADGGFHEFTKGPEILKELKSLQLEGYSGRQLIDNLISDDWGAPPIVVTISGTAENGNKVVHTIPYE
jgi:hypothetical protein